MVGVMSQSDSTEIDDYVRRVVEAAPPLTADQRAKLATLLSTGAAETIERGESSAS
jgi:hypothetical protein